MFELTRVVCLLALPIVLLSCVTTSKVPPVPYEGRWNAWLDSPGGPLPFGLELLRLEDGWIGTLLNGPERIPIPVVAVEGGRVKLEMPHYDSQITARVTPDGGRMLGHWSKRRGLSRWGRLPFEALAGSAPLPATPPEKFLGRWEARFDQTEEPAVAIFEDAPNNQVYGTFLTTTGDFRYLAGGLVGKRLRLSCFDGAHAFLFLAQAQEDGALTGNFWSGDSWHERWRAIANPEAELPDAFEQTIWTGATALGDHSFPDLEGEMRALDDPAYEGRGRIIHLFGSWCPNCHDAARYLAELDAKYAERGLSILGLAFEVTGDLERDTEQVARYVERHGAKYPVLVAGLADKDRATEQLPLLDRIRSYPTTIFMHGDGRVRAVHSGFSGPATGEAHKKLRKRFEEIIQEILAE